MEEQRTDTRNGVADPHDTRKKQTLVSSHCLIWRLLPKVQTESVTSGRNCAVLRRLQDKTHKTHVASSCLDSGSGLCWSLIIYSLDVSFLADSNNYHANCTGNAITNSEWRKTPGALSKEEVVGIITRAMEWLLNMVSGCLCVFLFACGLFSITTSSPASLTNMEHFLPVDSTEEWRENHQHDFSELTCTVAGQNNRNRLEPIREKTVFFFQEDVKKLTPTDPPLY